MQPTITKSFHSRLRPSVQKSSFRSSTMEDEEGYTALQLKGRRKPDNEEEYTALQFKGRTEPEDRQEDLRADPQGPRFQRPALWIIVLLTVLTVLLVLAVVGSGIWTEAHPMPSCPLHWELHGRKCYYFPEVSVQKNWSASHEDCSSRGSLLVVIEDKAELDYFTPKLTNQAWIGLYITPVGGRWTWVNGSTLNENVLRVTGADDGDRCGAAQSGSIVSERCINTFYWICQREAEMSCSWV